MKPDLRSHLGRVVPVRVDRPLGSRRPRHPDLVYPLNSGFVSGTVSGDGAGVDVSLVGWDAPVASAEAEIVAVVVREDAAEDKLVVVPPGASFPRDVLWAAVRFQERFFRSSLLSLAPEAP